MTPVNIRFDSATVIFKICLSQFSDISSTACLKASPALSTALSSSRGGSGEELKHCLLQHLSECSQHALCFHEPCRQPVSTRNIFCRIRANPGLISTEGWKRVKAQQYFSTEEPGQLQPLTLYIAGPFLHWQSVELFLCIS